MTRERIASIDSLRALAVFAVVWQHAATFTVDAPGGRIMLGVTLWGVPTLFLLSGLVAPRVPSAAQLKRRLVRLGVPFLVWVTLYVALRQSGVLAFYPPLSLGEIATGYVMGWPVDSPLWFLPALIYVSVIAHLLRGPLARRMVAGASFVAWAAIVSVIGTPYPHPMLFVAQSLLGLAMYLTGVEMQVLPAVAERITLPALASFALAAAAGSGLLYAVGWPMAATAFGAFLGVVLAFAARQRPDLMLPMRRAAFGVYLMHMPLIAGLAAVLHPANPAWSPAAALAAYVVAGGVTLALMRVRALRPLVS